MSALEIAALAAVLVAGLVLFAGMFLWIARLVPQAVSDSRDEALSANRETERSLVSSQEQSS